MNDLSVGMRKALIQIACGVTGCVDGFFDTSEERLDMRSVYALVRRGLVYYRATGGCPSVGVLDLTGEGWILFNEVRPT